MRILHNAYLDILGMSKKIFFLELVSGCNHLVGVDQKVVIRRTSEFGVFLLQSLAVANVYYTCDRCPLISDNS